MSAKTNDEMISVLLDKCAGRRNFEVAAELGISPTYLSDVLHSKREVSEKLALKLGFQRRIIFVPLGLST